MKLTPEEVERYEAIYERFATKGDDECVHCVMINIGECGKIVPRLLAHYRAVSVEQTARAEAAEAKLEAVREVCVSHTKKLATRHNCQRDTWAETLQALDAKLRGPDMTLTACHMCQRGFPLRDMREIGGKRLCIDCVIQENADLRDATDRLRCDLQFHKGEAVRAEVERLKAKPNA